MSYPQDSNMVALSLYNTMRLARCWKIVRSDGETFRYTEHDQVLTIGGENYKPMFSVTGTARRRQQNLQAEDAEISGMIVDDEIEQADLQAGLFADAKVIEFVVDWRYPWAGHHLRDIFFINELTFDGEVWQGKMGGLKSLLRQERGRVLNRLCGNKLGDNRCKVNLPDVTFSTTVTFVGNARRFFKCASLVGDQPDQYFRLGIARFLTGNNAGVSEEIASSRSSDAAFQLVLKLSADIQVGDTLEVVAGCNLMFLETCIPKFANGINFGGWPYLPGNDAMLRTPDSHV